MDRLENFLCCTVFELKSDTVYSTFLQCTVYTVVYYSTVKYGTTAQCTRYQLQYVL